MKRVMPFGAGSHPRYLFLVCGLLFALGGWAAESPDGNADSLRPLRAGELCGSESGGAGGWGGFRAEYAGHEDLGNSGSA